MLLPQVLCDIISKLLVCQSIREEVWVKVGMHSLPVTSAVLCLTCGGTCSQGLSEDLGMMISITQAA